MRFDDLTLEDFEGWLNLPETRAVLEGVEVMRQTLAEDMAAGASLDLDSAERTHAKTAYAAGKAEGYGILDDIKEVLRAGLEEETKPDDDQ